MLQHELEDDLIAPPGPAVCIPGLTVDLTQRIRCMQRWAIVNALKDNGIAMAECISGSPSRGRRRPWRHHRD
jgi:hypothetical protein